MTDTNPKEEWLVTPPEDDWSLDAWNEWKTYCATRSQRIFVRRNPWFTFSKEEIYENLKGHARIPRVLWHNREKPKATLSEILSTLDLNGCPGIAVKELLGHSAKQVKLLSLDRWPNEAFDHLRKTRHPAAELDDWFSGISGLIEEYLYSPEEPIPLDFKVYCRNGAAVSVLIIDRNGEKATLSYVNARDWSYVPWSEAFVADSFSQWLEGGPPSAALLERAQIAAAEAIRLLPVLHASDLFISLDMYVPNSEAWLGEITPRPGAVHANKLKTSWIKHILLSP